MADYIVRTIAKENGLRGIACVTTELALEAARRHNVVGAVAQVMGRALTAATLMGALLKVQQRISLKFAGQGPLRKIIVESDSYGKVRGYVTESDIEHFALAEFSDRDASGLGRMGALTVVKDLKMRDLYEGIVPLVDGSIDQDLTYYLNQSEQVPSVVQIGTLLDDNGYIKMAGGVLWQTMADAEPDILDVIKNMMGELPPIEHMLQSGHTPEDILAESYGEMSYTLLEERPVTFHCGCSRERSEKALVLIGEDELRSLMDQGEAVVDCHFCHERYIFDRPELEDLLAKVLADD